MSAWYYVINGDPAFLTEEEDATPARPIAWSDALAVVDSQLSAAGPEADTEDFELPGLWVQLEPVDDDGEVRGIGFNVGLSGAGDDQEGMAQLVKLMLAVADAVGGRAWSDDQQRWLSPDDIDGARRGDPV